MTLRIWRNRRLILETKLTFSPTRRLNNTLEMLSPIVLSTLTTLIYLCTQPAVGSTSSHSSYSIQKSEWNGFEKDSFSIGGASAYVVVPKISAPGKPWIWRTSFPDYRPVVDLELVRSGYHIGYVEILDLLGSDKALDLMDQFYGRVTQDFGLSPRPALEPCSRGGLPAYRYAARHPERIACIYGDVPVMDFKSWPFGRPTDRQSEWPKILQSYGFSSDREAFAYRFNPIDELAPVAKAKIPIRHVISLADKLVPPEQNTLEAKRRLRKLGSDLEVIVATEGLELEGHHFTYPDVYGSVRFVMDHTDVLPKGKEYFQLRGGLHNAKHQFEQGGSATVAFLGGSITYNPGWRQETERYLSQKFPKTKFKFVEAGIPSLGSVPHAFRLDRDVLTRGPIDLLFVEAAVNDVTNMAGHPIQVLRGMEGVVRHALLANAQTDIVVMHFATPEFMSDYRKRTAPSVIQLHERIAQHYRLTSLNLAEEVTDRIDAHEFTWEGDFLDLHPSPFGQRVYSNSIARTLDAAFAQSAPVAKPHNIPGHPVDPFSYFRGRFGSLEKAQLNGFQLVRKWIPTIASGTRDGFVNVPALQGIHPGDSFEFECNGTATGLMIGAGPDTGMIKVSVDGGKSKQIDTFTEWSQSLYLPWAIILADGLREGKHHVRVELSKEHNPKSVGTALYVFQLLEN